MNSKEHLINNPVEFAKCAKDSINSVNVDCCVVLRKTELFYSTCNIVNQLFVHFSFRLYNVGCQLVQQQVRQMQVFHMEFHGKYEPFE